MLGLGLLLTMRIVLRVLDQLVMLSVLLICKRNLLAMILVFSMSFLREEVSKYANRATAVLGMTVSRVKKRFRLVRVLSQYLVIRFFAVF